MKDIVIPVITGPTASGKSSLAYSLFNDTNFELISADAFQIYKKLDIGTAKPGKEIRKEIIHHQIDCVETEGFYSTGSYVRDTEAIIGNILKNKSFPLIVGGTGLYIQSLRDGIFEIPGSDKKYREELMQTASEKGSAFLYDELYCIDPDTAAKIHSNDLVRIIRGLEVYKLTGIPMSKAHKLFHTQPAFKYKIFVTSVDREELYSLVNARTDKMIEDGWLNEVSQLLEAGYSTDLPAFRAIGYSELAEVVQFKTTLEDAVPLIARKTRNYAKRQMTWFRGMADVSVLPADEIRKNIIEIYRNYYA